jgi:hypothetical protein
VAHYAKEPRWLAARFDRKCAKCGAVIKKGDRIFYYPLGRDALVAAWQKASRGSGPACDDPAWEVELEERASALAEHHLAMQGRVAA